MLSLVIVIYNQEICLAKYSVFNRQIVFCDNSTDAGIKSANKISVGNSNYKNFFYQDMYGNKGLPKAYNAAINVLNLGANDFVVILDQDTEIPADFIEKYENFISKNPEADIICPIVLDSVGVMSPSLSSGLKFKHINSVEDVNQKNIADYSFINSGICIKGSVFEQVKYDENLFLDLVDHDFILSSKKKNLKIAICFDVVLNQNFSGVTKNSYNQDYSRFSIYLNDAKHFYKKWFNNNYKFILLPRAIKLCILHKNISFLISLIKGN